MMLCLVNNKGHDVIELTNAVSTIREDLDKAFKNGTLKTDNTEGALIDIRQTLNACDQAKNKSMKEVEGAIKELIKALYERKDRLIEDISEYFATERQKIEDQEAKWREKQKITEDLLKMASSKDDDQALLENSKYIADGIKTLASPAQFKILEMPVSIDSVMHVVDDETGVKKADITHEELKRLISQYMEPNEYKKVQYKC